MPSGAVTKCSRQPNAAQRAPASRLTAQSLHYSAPRTLRQRHARARWQTGKGMLVFSGATTSATPSPPVPAMQALRPRDVVFSPHPCVHRPVAAAALPRLNRLMVHDKSVVYFLLIVQQVRIRIEGGTLWFSGGSCPVS